MAETVITLQVDPNLKKAFSLAAEAHNRTDEDLLREFMQDFVLTQRTDAEYEQWFRRQVQIGIDEATVNLYRRAARGASEINVVCIIASEMVLHAHGLQHPRIANKFFQLSALIGTMKASGHQH